MTKLVTQEQFEAYNLKVENHIAFERKTISEYRQIYNLPSSEEVSDEKVKVSTDYTGKGETRNLFSSSNLMNDNFKLLEIVIHAIGNKLYYEFYNEYVARYDFIKNSYMVNYSCGYIDNKNYAVWLNNRDRKADDNYTFWQKGYFKKQEDTITGEFENK